MQTNEVKHTSKYYCNLVLGIAMEGDTCNLQKTHTLKLGKEKNYVIEFIDNENA